jgi:hypothetical protein
MATINLDLAYLFENTFGYRTPAFEFNKLPQRKEYNSQGTPYFKKDQFGREYYMPVILNGHELPYPVMSVECATTVVSTPMVDINGSVDEIISIDNYIFTVRGIIISADHSYPESEIRNLRALHSAGMSYSITNAITDIFLLHPDRKGYDKVIIRKLTFPETRGVTNTRGYEMLLSSTAPFSLTEV